MSDDYFEEQFRKLFDPEEEAIDDPHKDHEVVKNFVYGEWFYYCRDCKIEVYKERGE